MSSTKRNYQLKGPNKRAYKKFRVNGREIGVYWDEAREFAPAATIAQINAWFEGAREQIREANPDPNGGVHAAYQEGWTIEDYLRQGFAEAKALPKNSERSIKVKLMHRRAIEGVLRKEGCPLSEDTVVGDVGESMLIDHVEWRRAQGNLDCTAARDLDFLGGMILLCSQTGAKHDPTSPYRRWRDLVKAVTDKAALQPSQPQEAFLEPRHFVRVGAVLDRGAWSNRHRLHTLRDGLNMLCSTGMDFAELAKVVPSRHVVKLVKARDPVTGTPMVLALRWNRRSEWAGTTGYMCVDMTLPRGKNWRAEESIASHKRRERGLRYVPVCSLSGGERLASLCLDPKTDPDVPLFGKLSNNTLRVAIKRALETAQILDEDPEMETMSVKGCRRTFSMWGERAGCSQVFLRKAMGHRGAGVHDQSYKPLKVADAYELAERISGYVDLNSRHLGVVSGSIHPLSSLGGEGLGTVD